MKRFFYLALLIGLVGAGSAWGEDFTSESPAIWQEEPPLAFSDGLEDSCYLEDMLGLEEEAGVEEDFIFWLDESGDAVPALPDASLRSMRRYYTSRSTEASSDLYASQLPSEGRYFYDAISQAWGNLAGTDQFLLTLQDPLVFEANGTISEGTFTWEGKTDPAYQAAIDPLRTYLQSSFDAFMYDSPEVYWIGRIGFSTHQEFQMQGDGSVRGIVDSITILGTQRWEGAVSQTAAFQTAVQTAAAELRTQFTEDLTDGERLRLIHDYICSHTSYSDNTYAHTAYGFFMNASQGVVCDGYAKAFKLLCDELGLRCLVVTGNVNKNGVLEGHMWNYVWLSGGWYLVDTTWDDENLSPYMYLFAGLTSRGLYGSVSAERTLHVRFSQSQYTQDFAVPPLSQDTLHAWKEYSRREPTCAETGTVITRCRYCGAATEEILPAIGHSWGEWEDVSASTCVIQGIRKRICQTCGEIEEEELPLSEAHDQTTWKIAKAATCTEAGQRQEVCRTCGKVVGTEEIPATGHADGIWTVTKEPDCTHQGEQVKTCPTCQALLAVERIPALGHEKAAAWVVTRQPTVLKKGLKTRNCTRCGETLKKKSIAKLTPTIRLNRKKVTMKVGQKKKPFTVSGLAKGDKISSWKSSKPSVASVNKKGKVIAKKTGKTTITLKLKSGLTRKLTVVVKAR